jgi:hypothetical protein
LGTTAKADADLILFGRSAQTCIEGTATLAAIVGLAIPSPFHGNFWGAAYEGHAKGRSTSKLLELQQSMHLLQNKTLRLADVVLTPNGRHSHVGAHCAIWHSP